jgi:hypothetical protein
MTEKLCIVKSSGILPIKSQIAGPILIPTIFSIEDIIVLVNCKNDVYEVNPNVYSQTIKLTKTNMTQTNF